MSSRIPLAGEEPPRQQVTPCPECGQPRWTPNGAWLRWRRQTAGLDQRTLARRLHVSGPYLSDLERNRRTVPTSVLRVYATLKRRPR
jgi:DNA-binding transcriptional regulator YiaG